MRGRKILQEVGELALRVSRVRNTSGPSDEEVRVTCESEETEDVEEFYYGEPLPDGGFAHAVRFLGYEVVLIHRRRFYKPYDESPMKGNLGMNARTKKFLAKRAIELIAATLIGYIIKAEKKYENRIDDHFEPPKADAPEED